MFPDRLAAGLKILALPTVVRIHLREIFYWLFFMFKRPISRRVFSPDKFSRCSNLWGSTFQVPSSARLVLLACI